MIYSPLGISWMATQEVKMHRVLEAIGNPGRGLDWAMMSGAQTRMPSPYSAELVVYFKLQAAGEPLRMGQFPQEHVRDDWMNDLQQAYQAPFSSPNLFI
jgi:hypothetical protein